MMRVLFFIAMLLISLTRGDFAKAQGLDMSAGNGEPLTIDAVAGIEWNQKTKTFTANGPAKATRGTMVLDADELRAFYRDSGSGKSEIFRLDAIGHVRITTPGRVATGGYAIYDVDKSVIVLRDGNPVKMVSGNDVITATEQLEFWELRDLAVARGNAKAVHADKKIQAQIMTAYFIKGADGKTTVDRIEAFDKVRIDTPNEQAFSDRAAYNVPRGLARLTGAVTIKRGSNVLNGCSADFDLNTGISRLNTCNQAPNSNGNGQTGTGTTKPGRVHGILSPRKK